MSTSLVQIRMEKELRDSANELFSELGLDMSTAVKMFLKKCLAEGGIPFSVKTREAEYRSPDGMAAMIELQKEAEENNLNGMTLDEINAEIAALRADRKSREKKGA